MSMAAGRVSAHLLDDIRNFLDVTWPDCELDRKLSELIASGMAYLDRLLGAAADYSAAGQPRTLLFEYVRYARDGAMDIFENNYGSLLLAMQSDKAVERYAQEADKAKS